MTISVTPPVSYKRYHYSIEIKAGLTLCFCDSCHGSFKHYGGAGMECKSLRRIDDKWLCINCRRDK